MGPVPRARLAWECTPPTPPPRAPFTLCSPLSAPSTWPGDHPPTHRPEGRPCLLAGSLHPLGLQGRQRSGELGRSQAPCELRQGPSPPRGGGLGDGSWRSPGMGTPAGSTPLLPLPGPRPQGQPYCTCLGRGPIPSSRWIWKEGRTGRAVAGGGPRRSSATLMTDGWRQAPPLGLRVLICEMGAGKQVCLTEEASSSRSSRGPRPSCDTWQPLPLTGPARTQRQTGAGVGSWKARGGKLGAIGRHRQGRAREALLAAGPVSPTQWLALPGGCGCPGWRVHTWAPTPLSCIPTAPDARGGEGAHLSAEEASAACR